MTKCTRKGCGKEYDQSENTEGACSFHPGTPVFHEGLKSWSCCQDVNKPVLDFESFMSLPGCTRGVHTSDKPAASIPAPVPRVSEAMSLSKTSDGKEIYTTSPAAPSTSTPRPAAPVSSPSTPAPPAEEDEDDLSVPVEVGTTCKRLGCGKSFVSNEESRSGTGENATCVYHPSPPIFREGSKGYLCCKRRVLEFDEFLKITGCKTGTHVFVKKTKLANQASEEFVKCRIDHYQTPREVRVSVFAKQVDKSKSAVRFEEDQLHLDLYLPLSKRFLRSVSLYGPIDPTTSSFQVFGTKVEVVLVKQDARSWNMLEKPPNDAALPAGFNLTFGVSGRTGTVGGKELILDEDNKLKAS